MPPTPDPRAIITPDSFVVAPDLLGLPLARPARRATAMAIDLLAVTLLAQAGAVFFGVLAAAALWRASASVQRSGGARGAGSGILRALMRMTAAVVAFVLVLNVVGSIGGLFSDDDDEADTGVEARVSLCEDGGEGMEIRDLTQVPLLITLDDAEDPQDARTAAAGVTQWLRGKGLDDDETRASLECLHDELDSEIGRDALAAEIARLAPAAGVEPARAESARATSAVSGAMAGGDSAVLAGADSAVLAGADSAVLAGADSARGVPAVDSVAAAQLAVLEARYDEAREENEELRAENARMDARIENFGMLDRVRSIADDLGLGFGWMALYFTALLVLFRGQTIGKRLMGVRVIRLDGRPLSWWMSFERFGGYAASLSTGLLGFLQILWDRNRQGLHDKAVETVVIRVVKADHD